MILPRTLEFSVKSGKHGTRTLSLVQNRVRLLKKSCKKKYISLRSGVKLRNAPFLLLNWASSSSFDPLFPFSWAPPLLLHTFSTVPTSTTTIITSNLVHQLLNFSSSYPDLIKLHYFVDLTQRGDRGGERRPKDRVKPGWLQEKLYWMWNSIWIQFNHQ